MRRIALVSLAALVVVACSNEATAPANSTDEVTDFSIGAFGTALTSIGGYDADLYQLRLFHGLPDALKLTSDQEAKINVAAGKPAADVQPPRRHQARARSAGSRA